MDRPLISALMTVYNGREFISEAIESVLSQTYSNIQFVIVNDGSTDDTEAKILGFDDERIEYYPLEHNRSIAYATNYGMERARGDYLAIIDSDDIWMPQKLELQLAFLNEHSEYEGCFSWPTLIDENGDCIDDENPVILDMFHSSTATREEWLRHFFFKGNRLLNPSSLITMNAVRYLKKHSPFFLGATDMEWWVRFTEKFSFGIIEEPLVRYRRLSDRSNVSAMNEKNSTRFCNECLMIQYHFFDDMDDELFIRTFREDFRYPDAATPEELKCEKAFLLCRPSEYISTPSPYGLLMLKELLDDPVTEEVLFSRYGFTTNDCAALTSRHLCIDYYVERDIADARASEDARKRFAEVENERNMLRAQLSDILDSRSWKLIARFNKIRRLPMRIFKNRKSEDGGTPKREDS